MCSSDLGKSPMIGLSLHGNPVDQSLALVSITCARRSLVFSRSEKYLVEWLLWLAGSVKSISSAKLTELQAFLLENGIGSGGTATGGSTDDSGSGSEGGP